jgi:hypothetical protein
MNKLLKLNTERTKGKRTKGKRTKGKRTFAAVQEGGAYPIPFGVGGTPAEAMKKAVEWAENPSSLVIKEVDQGQIDQLVELGYDVGGA